MTVRFSLLATSLVRKDKLGGGVFTEPTVNICKYYMYIATENLSDELQLKQDFLKTQSLYIQHVCDDLYQIGASI